MSKNMFILVGMILATATTLSSQSYIELFKNQNYEGIYTHLSPEVELKIDKDDKIKGANKVMQALKTKLSAFSPTKIETSHKGSSSENDGDYLIGKLYNAQGAGLRLFVHLENSAQGRRICAIKFRDI